MRPVRMWGIRDSRGDIVPFTVQELRSNAITEWVGPRAGRINRWRKWQRKGWKCVKVEVKEVLL